MSGLCSIDVLLQCHGITRELHKPYIRKSHTLSGLLQHAVISATACYEDSLPVISLPFSYTNVTQQCQTIGCSIGRTTSVDMICFVVRVV